MFLFVWKFYLWSLGHSSLLQMLGLLKINPLADRLIFLALAAFAFVCSPVIFSFSSSSTCLLLSLWGLALSRFASRCWTVVDLASGVRISCSWVGIWVSNTRVCVSDWLDWISSCIVRFSGCDYISEPGSISSLIELIKSSKVGLVSGSIFLQSSDTLSLIF